MITSARIRGDSVADSGASMADASPRALLASLAPPGGLPASAGEVAGEVSGRALKDWRGAITRGLGEGAIWRLREVTGLGVDQLPDSPRDGAWYPVSHQLRLALGALSLMPGAPGLPGLLDLLVTPSLGLLGRVKRNVLRMTVSPAMLLGRTERLHADLYRPGHAAAELAPPAPGDARSRGATIRWSGAAFHADPVWRALQVTALAGFFAALDLPLWLADATPPDPLPPRFTLALRW